jgi:threonine synthase
MQQFRQSGEITLDPGQHKRLSDLFAGHRLDDEQTLAAMKGLYQQTGELIDPHSAIGLAAARAVKLDPDVAIVALGTAHPAKFPDAVEKATGMRPPLPPALADLYQRPERFSVLANDLAALKTHIRGQVAAGRAA